MQTTFNCYTDSGHSWTKVPIEVLKELGIELKISTYSYWRNGCAFLEEDCDLTVLFNAMKKIGKEMKLNDFHTNNSSRIRNYSYYDSSKQ
jgi:hypothetical protein